MEEAAKAAAQAVEHVDSELKLAALIAVCILIGFGLYLAKIAGDGKKLVAEKEKAEMERTEHRKQERDAQINGVTARLDARINELSQRIDAEIKDLHEDFTEHIKKHETEDNRLYERLGKIESNIYDNAMVLARIETILEMNEKARAKEHGHNG